MTQIYIMYSSSIHVIHRNLLHQRLAIEMIMLIVAFGARNPIPIEVFLLKNLI